MFFQESGQDLQKKRERFVPGRGSHRRRSMALSHSFASQGQAWLGSALTAWPSPRSSVNRCLHWPEMAARRPQVKCSKCTVFLVKDRRHKAEPRRGAASYLSFACSRNLTRSLLLEYLCVFSFILWLECLFRCAFLTDNNAANRR